MVKGIVNNRSAAGLRRSAVAERLRLREEWSSLKGTDDDHEPPAKVKKKQTRAFSKNLPNITGINKIPSQKITNFDRCSRRNKENSQPQTTYDALRGVVALVDVGAESRALALRAALSALGATVVTVWSPLVTHLVWSQGGSRDTRAHARALACKVVSPLWVEACASSARRISEKVFPSTARDSDLPSPATLCRLLKTAEKENWLVSELQLDSEDDDRQIRLRISSDTDENTRNKTSGDDTTDSVDVETRVNTAPRRALPISMSQPPANLKSKRKLFTARADAEEDSDAENTSAHVTTTKTRPEKVPTRPDRALNRPQKASAQGEKGSTRVEKAPQRQKKTKKYNLTQEQKRNLENAEQMARKLAADPATDRRIEGTQTQRRRTSNVPRIVLSGMPKSQYQVVMTAIHTLKGRVQKHVDHRTTHVLLGSCKEDQRREDGNNQNIEQQTWEIPSNKTPQQSKNNLSTNKTVKPFSICNECNSPEGLVMKMFECDNVEVTNHCSNPTTACDKDVTIICSTVNRNPDFDVVIIGEENGISDVRNNHNISDVCNGILFDKRLRTLKTLLGAARGCRVLHAQWALDSLKEKKWLPHIGYEVMHLLKIAQKARVERYAIEKMHADYGYNVFRGMRVSVTERAHQRDAAVQLLSLCGAEIVNESNIQSNSRNIQNVDKTTQDGRRTQNGGFIQNGADSDDDCDIIVIGKAGEEISSKWVFDSVAAGRPRTTRRYINKNIITL